MSDRTDVARGINILILESGGATGLSPLLILHETMGKLQRHAGLDEMPKVYEHFDIVAGAGTGAVGACMIGRLRISTEQAIVYYQMLARVFSDKKRVASNAPFKITKLQEVLKEIIGDATGDENTRLIDTRPDADRCRTMIFAMSEYNMTAGTPRLFRSYQGTANQLPDLAIWQTLCATMAFPGLFKSFKVLEGSMRESFVGGALSCSNPIEHVLVEAKSLFPNQHVASIVSIGTGHSRTIQMPAPGLLPRLIPRNVLTTMQDIATDNERAAQAMALRFQHAPNVYFRFNVEQGMQDIELSDWQRLGEVSAHTRAYMRKVETIESVKRLVGAIHDGECAIGTRYLDGQVPPPEARTIRQCPDPTPVFTGQQDKIDQVEACIINGDRERRVFVLHGLGGAGKTQIALKAVERTRNMWAEIVYIDATSRETVVSALESFGRAKGVQGDSHRATLSWLEARQERWLMLFDNVDDPSLRIQDFFPRGNRGSILITTRIFDMTLITRGPRSHCEVSSMEPGEALELLLKTADMNGEILSDRERETAVRLLQDFGHLALAVVHAGAYIRRSGLTIRQYMDLFTEQHQDTLDRYTESLVEVDEYQQKVYTTWRISYERLSSRAQRLLGLIAFMHHDNITGDIFKYAAINSPNYRPRIPMPEDEDDAAARTYVQDYLRAYLDSASNWNYLAFLSDINELKSYSLVGHDQRNDAYTVHVLVHDWAGTVVACSQALAVKRTMFLLAVSIDPDDTPAKLAYKRSLEMHVNRVLQWDVNPGGTGAMQLGEVYRCMLRWYRKEPLDILVLNAWRQSLGEEHPDTLASVTNLAGTYSCQGRYDLAEDLLRATLDVSERAFGGAHPNTLGIMGNLALAYLGQSRFQEAEVLQRDMLDGWERLFGAGHPHTLASMSCLARTYWNQGRYADAEGLQIQVLDVSKRTFGDHHPTTLANMSNLASTYLQQRQYQKAEALTLSVLDSREQQLGNEHPHTMMSMVELIHVYQYLGQYEKGEALVLQLLEIRKRSLGDDHPETLWCIELCSEYQKYKSVKPLVYFLLHCFFSFGTTAYIAIFVLIVAVLYALV